MQIELLPHQSEAIESDKKQVLMLGGVGSGKTYLGSVWILKQYKNHPESTDMICACTYSQLRRSTLASVFANFAEWDISFSYNQQSGILLVNNTKRFLCVSLEAAEMVRGVEVGAVWFDEVAFAKLDSFNIMLGRIRDKRGSLTSLLTTTPNGINNWLYHLFGNVDSDDQYKHIVRCATSSNRHLPPEYISHLEDSYDEKLRQQELEGQWVNLTSGKTYRCFTREANLSDNTRVTSLGTTLIGMDFNVDPMTAVVCRIQDDTVYVQDEIFLRNSDTFEMCKELRDRNLLGATIVPDSTLKNRKTSGKSDFFILKEQGFKIAHTRNPLVIDRVNNVNRLLTRKKIIINKNKCPNLIKDLEMVTWRGGNKLDQSDGLRTHLSDCLGYVCWKYLPLKKPATNLFTGAR